jgi:hypothetical protein
LPPVDPRELDSSNRLVRLVENDTNALDRLLVEMKAVGRIDRQQVLLVPVKLEDTLDAGAAGELVEEGWLDIEVRIEHAQFPDRQDRRERIVGPNKARLLQLGATSEIAIGF